MSFDLIFVPLVWLVGAPTIPNDGWVTRDRTALHFEDEDTDDEILEGEDYPPTVGDNAPWY